MTDPSDHTETLPGASAPAGAFRAAPPRVLGDRYRLDELVANGGMASVWRAHDAILARTVAVKLLHDHLAVDVDFRERFRREAIAAARLAHPHVVGVYDTGTEGDRVYLVMEFVAGTTLRDVIAERGRLGPGEAATIGERVARALDYAHHRGLVHRDVKPANILVGEDGDVKVADFGIAKADGGGDDLTRTGMVLGTAAYVAPEQILGERIDGAADQYALGCVLYEALTGQQPFRGDSAVGTAAQRLEHDPRPIRQLVPEVPEGLERVVLRAMARQPRDRHPSLGHLADGLATFADGGDGQTAPIVVPPRSAPAVARGARPTPRGASAEGGGGHPSRPASGGRRWVVTAVVAVVLLAVGVLAWGWVGGAFLDRGEQDGAGEEAAAATGPLEPADIVLFDPGGSGSEDGEELPALFDGDPSTAWQSVGYNSPDFGNLKPGLGFYVDLGAAHRLERVELVTDTPGIDVELRVADDPGGSADEWDEAAAVGEAPETIEFSLAEQDVVARYVLVWVTGNLAPDGSRHRVRFSEMAVEGAPA